MTATKAQLKANAKYRKKAYDQLSIRLPKGERERFAEYASKHGVSLAEYVRRACYHAGKRQWAITLTAYAGWSISIDRDWIVAERIDNGEEGWLAAPLTADHMAKLAEIEEARSSYEQEHECIAAALEAIKEWEPIRHGPRSGFTAYRDDEGWAYFEDDLYRYKTKELITPYLVGCDDDGGYYYFRDGLGSEPVDLLELVIGEPKEL